MKSNSTGYPFNPLHVTRESLLDITSEYALLDYERHGSVQATLFSVDAKNEARLWHPSGEKARDLSWMGMAFAELDVRLYSLCSEARVRAQTPTQPVPAVPLRLLPDSFEVIWCLVADRESCVSRAWAIKDRGKPEPYGHLPTDSPNTAGRFADLLRAKKPIAALRPLIGFYITHFSEVIDLDERNNW